MQARREREEISGKCKEEKKKWELMEDCRRGREYKTTWIDVEERRRPGIRFSVFEDVLSI